MYGISRITFYFQFWQHTINSDLTKGWGQDSRVGGHQTHLPLKIHQKDIYMWTNPHWKLTGEAERLLYNQGCKKYLQGVRYKGKRSDQVGTCAPGRGLRRGGGLHGQRPSLGSEWFKPYIGRPSPWAQHQEDKSPWLVKGPVGLKGKPRLHSWGVHTCLLTPETGWRGQIETAWDTGQFPETTLVWTPAWTECQLWPFWLHSVTPHWARAAVAEGRAQLWRTKAAQTHSEKQKSQN